MHEICSDVVDLYDFYNNNISLLSPSTKGESHGDTHTIIDIHTLAHILGICPLIFSSALFIQFIPINRIM